MKPFSLNLRGKLVEFTSPVVMGIVNVTPDSFYSESRTSDEYAIKARVEEMLGKGAGMLDVGGYSSRPGASEISEEEETRRVALGLKVIRETAPDAIVSVDTFRSGVALRAVRDYGADIINDISGGDLDEKMFDTVVKLGVPYILMHMRGNPQTMKTLTDYPMGVTAEVLTSLADKISRLSYKGLADIIIDPGFGFAKTMEQNFRLLEDLPILENALHRPLLAGMSRKSMITRLLGCDASEALNGTTAANTLALDRGAAILRVHDVKQAIEAVKIYNATVGDHQEPMCGFS